MAVRVPDGGKGVRGWSGPNDAEPVQRSRTTSRAGAPPASSPPPDPAPAAPRRLRARAVDATISGAARTIERLQTEVTAARDEVARLQAAQAKLQEELTVAARRSPQEIVGDVLYGPPCRRIGDRGVAPPSSARAGGCTRETLQILARAQELLDEAAATHRDAEAVVADSHTRARAVIEAGEAEAKAHVASATELAARRQAQLEVENARSRRRSRGFETNGSEGQRRLSHASTASIPADRLKPRRRTEQAERSSTTCRRGCRRRARVPLPGSRPNSTRVSLARCRPARSAAGGLAVRGPFEFTSTAPACCPCRGFYRLLGAFSPRMTTRPRLSAGKGDHVPADRRASEAVVHMTEHPNSTRKRPLCKPILRAARMLEIVERENNTRVGLKRAVDALHYPSLKRNAWGDA